MDPQFLSREQVARQFAISNATILRYERRGLVRAASEADGEGYGPAEIRRLWTILTFQRDLGINLAGIEVILRLRDHMAETHDRLDRLARALLGALEGGADADGSS